MTTNDLQVEKKSKKDSKHKNKATKISNGLSKLNLSASGDGKPAVAEDSSAIQSLSKKEKKRKRKELEGEDNDDMERSPKKKKKSHQEIPSTSGDGLNGESEVKKEHKKKNDTQEQHLPTQSQIQDFLSENSIAIQGDVTPILSFSQLDIPEELQQCLQSFTAPTPIQACSWPPLLAGRDVVGIAETGRYVRIL